MGFLQVLHQFENEIINNVCKEVRPEDMLTKTYIANAFLEFVKNLEVEEDDTYYLEERATMFHRELSELHFVKTIVTTNWDTYFEDYCAAVPITIPEDFVYWDVVQIAIEPELSPAELFQDERSSSMYLDNSHTIEIEAKGLTIRMSNTVQPMLLKILMDALKEPLC